MPELPEVETICRNLAPLVQGKKILRSEIRVPRLIGGADADALQATVRKKAITSLCRRGKYLLLQLDSCLWLIIHLRMTGRLVYELAGEKLPDKHVSAVFHLDDGNRLRLEDQRKFATLDLVDNLACGPAGLRSLGPEPLEGSFTSAYLAQILQSRRPVKSILLDQQKIAGLGNIYADESLHRAKIHPLTLGNSISPSQVHQLHATIQAVLTEAIASSGTTIRDYRTGYGDPGRFQRWLRVYGKSGQHCSCCRTSIKRIKIAGRSSHFCPSCQEGAET